MKLLEDGNAYIITHHSNYLLMFYLQLIVYNLKYI